MFLICNQKFHGKKISLSQVKNDYRTLYFFFICREVVKRLFEGILRGTGGKRKQDRNFSNIDTVS